MAAPENLLGRETSPYLLQHANNPVHWRPWGKAALDEAQQTNKPILVSIGYAACHWCHVMAHESFENPETAALMNTLFVNIKIDREERPDIDHIYMSALHALGEQGGWPLTMFTTPDGTPFWGGTYFPPEARWGRPSFRQVLQGVANAFHSKADAVTQNTQALKQHLERQAAATVRHRPRPSATRRRRPGLPTHDRPRPRRPARRPKIPQPADLPLPLAERLPHRPAPQAQDALHLMLQRMSQGGIYDHLGGGYARYSTDEIWLVPHFEKMLYDNAQLLELLALAHAHRPDPLYAQRAAETVGWMIRDMTAQRIDGHAAFAASEDADSEGEEGRFYVWTEPEIDSLLGANRSRLQTRLRRHPERQLGRPHHPAPRHPTRHPGRGIRPGLLAENPVPGPRKARPPRLGRQGARRLERPGDRRAGPRGRRSSANPHGWTAPAKPSTSSSPTWPPPTAASTTPGASAASPPPA